MRLKTRLDRLETGTPSELTRSDKMLLVSILARRDALFWPWRFQWNGGPPYAEIKRRQKEYLAGQIGVAVKADGRAAWKDAHAARQRLIASGMITATHSSGQVQSVFLTPLGEATARALVGSRLHTVASAEPIFIYLIIQSKKTKCSVVRESVLLNRDCVGCPTDWDWLTEMMLPLLTCGIVDANSDTQGRACYTPRVDTVPEPEAIEVSVESHDDFDDAYLKSWSEERDMLHGTEPRDPHEIYIPLPASGWGWPVHSEEATS